MSYDSQGGFQGDPALFSQGGVEHIDSIACSGILHEDRCLGVDQSEEL